MWYRPTFFTPLYRMRCMRWHNIYSTKTGKLASKMLQGNIHVLHMLSQKSRKNWRDSLKELILQRGESYLAWPGGVLPAKYVLEKHVSLLLEELWAECQRSAEDKLLELLEKESFALFCCKSRKYRAFSYGYSQSSWTHMATWLSKLDHFPCCGFISRGKSLQSYTPNRRNVKLSSSNIW